MKTVFILVFVSLVFFAGCATQNSREDIKPLEVGVKPEQQQTKKGLSTSLAPANVFDQFSQFQKDRSFHSEIAFYETTLSYGPLADPRPIFLLTNAYIISNQQKYGIDFLERLLKRYENNMTADIKAAYLSAYALLRATYADEVIIFSRISWVLDTFDILQEAKTLSENNPLVHWASGLIYSQVPWFFGKKDAALTELLWLAERPETEPTPGFYREVYHHLSRLYADKGEADLSDKYLKKSGYERYEPSSLFMGWYATTKDKGLLFSPTPWIEEIVSGRVFAIRGFGFSDIHFIVSKDGRNLFLIDAGTQPYSMKSAHKFLLKHYPELPALSAVFITHAHWDHVGGYKYIKSLGDDITVYGRGNYQSTVERVIRQPVYKQFRGKDFKNEWVSSYKPDISVDELTKLILGDTSIELIPVTGGETEDALLINLPSLGVVFMGDVLMPYYGEPWIEEGFIDEALDAMDQALQRQPKHILHGHLGITVMYGNSQQLAAYRNAYQWLVEQTRKHIKNGYSVKEIVRLNLIPPGLENHPDTFLGYLAPRDHIIARISDQMLGIWSENSTGTEPEGLDNITAIEYGRFLAHYLNLSVGEVEKALRKILDGGDNELALQMAIAAEARYENNSEITHLKLEAADRLRSAVQYFGPFKFTAYTEMIGKEHQTIPEMIESETGKMQK